MLLFLIHLESPTGLILIIQLFMGQAIIITIGFRLLDLATTVMMGGEIIIGSENPLSPFNYYCYILNFGSHLFHLLFSCLSGIFKFCQLFNYLDVFTSLQKIVR